MLILGRMHFWRGARKIKVHIHDDPTGAAWALKMWPTTEPFVSTSKSSSFHWPEYGLADAHLRMRQSLSYPFPIRTN